MLQLIALQLTKVTSMVLSATMFVPIFASSRNYVVAGLIALVSRPAKTKFFAVVGVVIE